MAKLRPDHTGLYIEFPDDMTESEIQDALESRYVDSLANVSPIKVKPITQDPGPKATFTPGAPQQGPLNANQEDIDLGAKGYRRLQSTDPFWLSTSLKTALSAGPGYTDQFLAKEVRNKLDPDRSFFGEMRDLALLKQEDGKFFYLNAKTPANPNGDNRWVKLPTFAGTAARETAGAVVGGGSYFGGATAGQKAVDAAAHAATGRGNFPLGANVANYGNYLGPKIGGAVATTVGMGALDAGRMWLGEKLGVNEGITGGEIASEATETALGAGVTSFLGDIVLSKFPNFGKGAKHQYFFDPKISDDVERGLADSDPVVNRKPTFVRVRLSNRNRPG